LIDFGAELQILGLLGNYKLTVESSLMNKPQIAFKSTLTEKYKISTTSILSRWSIFDAP
jgi:hypothetical protein